MPPFDFAFGDWPPWEFVPAFAWDASAWDVPAWARKSRCLVSRPAVVYQSMYEDLARSATPLQRMIAPRNLYRRGDRCNADHEYSGGSHPRPAMNNATASPRRRHLRRNIWPS